jgi:hypothetical protein
MIRTALPSLIRACARVSLAGALMACVGAPAFAQTKPAQKPATGQAAPKQTAAPNASAQKPSTSKPAAQKPQAAEPGKPTLVATVGEWGVYVTSGSAKQCYALSQPKDRLPKDLKRDAAYLFISSRPSEKVRNEVSIIMGFDVKGSEQAGPEASIGSEKFALASQGSHLWIRDAARAGAVVDVMRKGAKLTVKAASLRGNVTTDSYSLSGIAGALDRVQKECP